MESRLTLVRVVQTSMACPSQWDAWDANGNYYYLKYRYGYGQVRGYRTADWVEASEDQLIEVVADFEHGHPLDGMISMKDFARLAGITIAENAMVTDFGNYLRDELVLYGALSLEEGDEQPELPGQPRDK